MTERDELIREAIEISNKRYKTKEDRYIKIKFNTLNNPKFRKENRSPFTVFSYLRKYIVRDRGNKFVNKFIYDNYYKKNMLAASLSMGTLAEDFGYKKGNKAQIKRFIDTIIKNKWAKVESVDVGQVKKQNIYIFGTYIKNKQGDIIERYYFDIITSQ